MAIVDYEELPEKKPEPLDPVMEPKHHKSILVDTEYVPRTSILTQINGAPWKVDFYSQVLGKDSALYGHSPDKDALNQAYIKTCDLVLKVTSPLSSSQDNKTNEFEVTGTATVMPNIRPNQGDMFVANIGDGRKGIFRITQVEQKSYFKEAVTEINYLLAAYADGSGLARYQDLEKKTIETRHYVHEFSLYHQNPFTSSEDYGLYTNIKERYRELLERYIRYYYSKRYKTLIVPQQKNVTYDHFLTQFFHRSFNLDGTEAMDGLKVLNVNDDYKMQALSFWDMLLDRDADMREDVFTCYTLVTTQSFTQEPLLGGIRYSGIQETVLPINPRYDVDMESQVSQYLRDRITLDASQDTRAYTNHQGTPLIYPACKSGSYVLSQAFYREDKHMSLLEAQVLSYIRTEPVDREVLKALLKDYTHWGALERFYYTPILLLLMHSVIREM